MRLTGIQPPVPRELFDRPLPIIFERMWSSGKVPKHWKKADVSPIFSKGKEENLGTKWQKPALSDWNKAPSDQISAR